MEVEDAPTDTTMDATSTTMQESTLLEGGDVFDLGKDSFSLLPHVLRSLDIFEGKGSLFKLLNKCGTPQGTRLLEKWIGNPLTDVQELDYRLDLVEYFFDRPTLRSKIADAVKKFPDFKPLVHKLERKKVNLQDLYKVYLAVQRIPALVAELRSEIDDAPDRTSKLLQERFIGRLEFFYEQLENYRTLIEHVVDVSYILKTGEYRVKPNITPSLQEIHTQLEDIMGEMEEDWDSLASDVHLEKEKTLKFEHDGRLGYLYRVTRKEEKQLRQYVDKLGLITVDTKQSGFRFRTSALVDLNKKYTKLTKEYEANQEEVIDELKTTAATFHEPCSTFDGILAPLDIACSLARVAYDAVIPYVRPSLLPKEIGSIELVDNRHPCMEAFLHRDFIANSVRFQHEKETFHIITGPNMGGKSTFIRQVALNVILTQIGSFVPCRSATVSLVDGIYTRIGSGDSVSKGVSTFMMEMLEAQDILKMATRYSLIVIDELGRGTSTYDGYGLAYAIAEHIAIDLGSYCLFTTHFNELASLQKDAKTVVLNHVSALVADDGLVFQYVVQPGNSSQSFGINVGKISGLPDSVIQDASIMLEELERTHHLGVTALNS